MTRSRSEAAAAAIAACWLLAGCVPVAVQDGALGAQLAGLVDRADGEVGVAVRDLDNGGQLAINGKTPFPMQSVFKFPLALAVLRRVDRRELSLEQVVHIEREQLLPDTWSPIRDAH